MNLLGVSSLILFLVFTTVIIGLMNPSFAIFPAFILFLVGVGLFFRPTKRRKKRHTPSPKPFQEKHNFDGPYSARAYSRLSLLDEMTREKASGKQSNRDQDIGSAVRMLLAADPALHAAGIEAESRFGRVTLVGRVKDEAERDRARMIAESVSGVNSVNLQIRLLPRTGGRIA